MPTVNIKINDLTSATEALSGARFIQRLSEMEREEVRRSVEDIERRGKELSAIGSQFQMVKILNFDDHTVKIVADYGVPQRMRPLQWLGSFFCRP